VTEVALDLAQGSWQMAEAHIDKEVGRFSAADHVEAGAIRRLLEVHEWDYPPSYDHAAARACGHTRLVAPASTYLSWALPAYWQPGDPPMRQRVIPPLPYRDIPGEGTMMVATEVAATFIQPIYVGDRIHATYWLRSVTPKTTRVGRGAFLTFEARFSNHDGAVVAQEHTTVLRYEPRYEPEEDRGDSSRTGPEAGNSPSEGTDAITAARLDLTLQRLVMAAGSNRDFAPVHHDPMVAAASGMGAPFVNSMFVGTQLERTAMEWAGWTNRTKSLEFRLLRPAPMGSTMSTSGWAVPDSLGTECQLTAICDRQTTSTGSVRLLRQQDRTLES
jgi:acyl dehydratase